MESRSGSNESHMPPKEPKKETIPVPESRSPVNYAFHELIKEWDSIIKRKTEDDPIYESEVPELLGMNSNSALESVGYVVALKYLVGEGEKKLGTNFKSGILHNPNKEESKGTWQEYSEEIEEVIQKVWDHDDDPLKVPEAVEILKEMQQIGRVYSREVNQAKGISVGPFPQKEYDPKEDKTVTKKFEFFTEAWSNLNSLSLNMRRNEEEGQNTEGK